MGLKGKTVEFEWYVPFYGGNRDRYIKHLKGLPGGDPKPFAVEIRVPTYAEIREALRGATADPERAMSEESNDEFFAKHVRGVAEYEFEGRPIETGKKLIALKDRVDGDLIAEVYRAINSRGFLEPGLKNGLSSQYMSTDSSPKIGGTAASAESGA